MRSIVIAAVAALAVALAPVASFAKGHHHHGVHKHAYKHHYRGGCKNCHPFQFPFFFFN